MDSYARLGMIFSLPPILLKDDLDIQFKKVMADDLLDSLDSLSLLAGAPMCNAALEKLRDQVSGMSAALKVEGAFIAIEPSSGYITTMIGGSEYSVSNQYNRAVQARRQPGSSFKPFVYGAGMESRLINPAWPFPTRP